MRALLSIPTRPPPTLAAAASWSPEMAHFLASALTKTPAARPSARELLSHPWVSDAVARMREGSAGAAGAAGAAAGGSPAIAELVRSALPLLSAMRREEAAAAAAAESGGGELGAIVAAAGLHLHELGQQDSATGGGELLDALDAAIGGLSPSDLIILGIVDGWNNCR
jgi:hypothetical protein